MLGLVQLTLSVQQFGLRMVINTATNQETWIIRLVVCGRRHHNCFLTAFELNGGKKIEGLNEVNERAVQGFLTSDDRFVDRKDGGQIAFDAGQTAKLTECLFSEDLY